MMLEGAAMDASVLSGYKQSAGMIKNIQKAMNVEDVDEVMDDLAEAMDIGRDVSEAIGREIGPSVAEVIVLVVCICGAGAFRLVPNWGFWQFCCCVHYVAVC